MKRLSSENQHGKQKPQIVLSAAPPTPAPPPLWGMWIFKEGSLEIIFLSLPIGVTINVPVVYMQVHEVNK